MNGIEVVDKIVMVAMDDHLTLQLPTPGRCGGCSTMRSFFINRAGLVLCVHCDARSLERAEMNARVTFKMMQGPVVITCRCPVSRDPAELFKCFCEAREPENRIDSMNPGPCNCGSITDEHANNCTSWLF